MTVTIKAMHAGQGSATVRDPLTCEPPSRRRNRHPQATRSARSHPHFQKPDNWQKWRHGGFGLIFRYSILVRVGTSVLRARRSSVVP